MKYILIRDDCPDIKIAIEYSELDTPEHIKEFKARCLMAAELIEEEIAKKHDS